MPVVNVTLGSGACRTIAAIRGRIVRDDFRESDHPRATNGQFGSSGTAHVVTTHDADTGKTDFHHVGGDEGAAAEERDRVDGEGVAAEHHAVAVEGKEGQRGDAVHIVHAADGAGGVDVHGVYLSDGAARGQAVMLSEAEWDMSGPTRAEAGLSDLEKVDVAQAWNDEHADDHDGVLVRVDADGDPVLNDGGDFVFEQDGEEVDPGDEIRAAFDDVVDEMYPADDVAAYPGLDEANEHFEGEGRHEAVFRIHEHRAE